MRRTGAIVLSLVATFVAYAVPHATSARASSLRPVRDGQVTRSVWRQRMQRLATPGVGCFQSSYPVVGWQRVSCHPAPDVAFAPPQVPTAALGTAAPEFQVGVLDGAPIVSKRAGAFGPVGEQVAGGPDYSAHVTSGAIVSATGSFPYVSPGISESGMNYETHRIEANSYSLQLNTQFIDGAPACSGAKNVSACAIWEQFVYSADYGGLFIQYWLVSYGATCPLAWKAYGSDCYRSSPGTLLTASLPTVQALSTVSLTGTAKLGGNDSIVMIYGAGHVSAETEPDSVLNIGGLWNTAQFTIVGDGDSTQAKFSAGTVLDVKTGVNYGATAAPVCSYQGFTAESNNLNFASAPSLPQGSEPAIETQQSSSGGAAGCAAAAQSPVSIVSPGARTTNVGNPVHLQLQGNDTNSGQSLAWSASGLPAGLTISSGGLISGTPTRAQTTTSTITATDTAGASDAIVVTWQVNAKRALKVGITVRRRNLYLKITPGTGTTRKLQCSLIHLHLGRKAGKDVWYTCWTSTVYKNLPRGRYRLRVRGTGGEVTRTVTIR